MRNFDNHPLVYPTEEERESDLLNVQLSRPSPSNRILASVAAISRHSNAAPSLPCASVRTWYSCPRLELHVVAGYRVTSAPWKLIFKSPKFHTRFWARLYPAVSNAEAGSVCVCLCRLLLRVVWRYLLSSSDSTSLRYIYIYNVCFFRFEVKGNFTLIVSITLL